MQEEKPMTVVESNAASNDNQRKQHLEIQNPKFDFWRDWLNDKMQESDDVESVLKLFDQALTYFPHLQLADFYCDYISRLVEEEKLNDNDMRAAYEKVLGICGFDIFSGSALWKKYRDFEIDEHQDLLEVEASEEIIQKSKERFIKVFHRQLSLPLVGNEETLIEFEKNLENYCNEKDVHIINPTQLSKRVENSIEEREKRLIYEQFIYSKDYKNSEEEGKVKSWQGYIEFENNQKQLSRVQRLYERSLIECPNSFILWLNYLEFSLNVLKNYKLVGIICEKSLKLFPSNYLIRRVFIGIMEFQNVSYLTMEKEVLKTINVVVFSDPDNYLEILSSLCGFCTRSIVKTLGKKLILAGLIEFNDEDIFQIKELYENLLKSFSHVEGFLVTYYAEWSTGWWKFWKIQSYITKKLQVLNPLLQENKKIINKIDLENMLKCFNDYSTKATKEMKIDTWEVAIKKFPTSYFFYQEYINFSIANQDFVQARSILRRILHLNLDVNKVDIAKDWLFFENLYGSINVLLEQALPKVFPTFKEISINIYNAKIQENEEIAVNNKRKRENDGNNELDKKDKKNRFGEDTVHPIEKLKNDKMEVDEKSNETDKKSNLYLQITNFPFTAEKSEMIDFIKNCLKMSDLNKINGLTEIITPLSKAGRSLGALVFSFDSEENMYKVLKMMKDLPNDTLTFSGRLLRFERGNSVVPKPKKKEVIKDSEGKSAGSIANPHLTTVFISKMPLDVTESQVRSHFEGCGEIFAVKMIVDKKSKESKGSSLVQFTGEEGRNKALNFNNTKMHGQTISVTPSRFSIITSIGSTTEKESDGNKEGTNEKDSSSKSNNKKDEKSERKFDEKGKNDKSLKKKDETPKKNVSTTSFKPRGVAKRKI